MGLGKRRFEGKRLQGAEKKVEKLRSRQGDKRQTDGVTGPEMESVRRREGGRERERSTQRDGDTRKSAAGAEKTRVSDEVLDLAIREMKAVERFGGTPGGRGTETGSFRERGGRRQKRYRENRDTKEGWQRWRGPRHRDREPDTRRDRDVGSQQWGPEGEPFSRRQVGT